MCPDQELLTHLQTIRTKSSIISTLEAILEDDSYLFHLCLFHHKHIFPPWFSWCGGDTPRSSRSPLHGTSVLRLNPFHEVGQIAGSCACVEVELRRLDQKALVITSRCPNRPTYSTWETNIAIENGQFLVDLHSYVSLRIPMFVRRGQFRFHLCGYCRYCLDMKLHSIISQLCMIYLYIYICVCKHIYICVYVWCLVSLVISSLVGHPIQYLDVFGIYNGPLVGV